jgi:aquaporin Z
MGAVSGAHLNPAVTLAFAVRGNFPWSRGPGYVLGQVAGCLGGAFPSRHVRHDRRAWGDSASGIGNGKALAMEVLLTTGLVNTILGTASGARNIGTNGAIALGEYMPWQDFGQCRSPAPR